MRSPSASARRGGPGSCSACAEPTHRGEQPTEGWRARSSSTPDSSCTDPGGTEWWSASSASRAHPYTCVTFLSIYL